MFFLGIAGVWYGFFSPTKAPKTPKAPGFSLPDFKNQERSSKEFLGSVHLVHFWASWCDPCVEEVPDLLELAKKTKDSSFKIIAISLDKSWQEAQKIIHPDQLPSNVISLLDTSAKVPAEFGSYQYPESYLVGAQGEVLMKWVGPQKWNNDKLIEALKKQIQ